MEDDCISSDLWKHWDKQGKAEFMKKCKHLVNASSTVSPIFSKTNGLSTLPQMLYELFWQGLRGTLKKDSVITAVEELIGLHRDMPSIILDVVNIVDAETSGFDGISEERMGLAYIIKECEKALSEKLLKERLEIETLQEMKILNNRNFYTKFIKVKTKLYYKQRKFNLFREESEGYAKLITELTQDILGNVTPVNILEIIKSLIGCFNLDPNRVLVVILDVFETRLDEPTFFVSLLRGYMADPSTLAEVLGYKYSFYQSAGSTERAPSSLYRLTATLLQHGAIRLDDIYPWLIPDDSSIIKDWEKELKDAKEFVRKLNMVSIKEKGKEDATEEKDDEQEKYESNQKFGLCEALLEVGDWENCQQLCDRLPEHCLMEQSPVALAMCRLLHSLIEPVYRKYCPLGAKIPGKRIPPPASLLAPRPAQTFLELRAHFLPMLHTLGPALRLDLVLVYKVLRVFKAALSQAGVEAHSPPPEEDTLYYDTISLLDEVIFPTLSFLDSNCCVAEEIWSIIKLYPYQCRYCLYARWKNETYQHHAKLIRRRGEVQKKIKSIMMRVSMENIKPVGRHIGKITHYQPGFLFDYVLIQIQIYDNLIVPVVDSLKYLASLSYDVLGYCVIESLGTTERERFKHDGTSLSSWLQSLAVFCGSIFKKYSIELTGLLQYLTNELKMQKSLDLLILKEIVQKMAGIECAEEMTKDQLEAMAGGELLKGEAGYFSQVRNTKKSSQRLKEALSEHSLAVALCLLMAQQRYCVVYRETGTSHLKLVGKLYDQCQDTLVQFGTFLGSTLSMEEYVTRLPSIHLLLAEYHINMDVAFFLARPMFSHAINIRYEALRKADPNCKKLGAAAKQVKYCEAAGAVMAPIAASVRPLHPPKVWEDISPQFLVTFWSLTMYDLFVPADAYAREVAKLRQLAESAGESKELPANKLKKEQERYYALMEKLQDEKKKQQEHVEKVMARLKQEKDSWFLSRSAKSAKNETITQFLQLCLFPRCVFTTTDAAYCAKFVHTLHSLKTANFSTLLCYDRLFCDITYSVTSCTENEANRYGRFLCEMLSTVMRWHSERAIFERECAAYPGFVTKFRVSNQFSEANDHVGYENYRHVCHKWHYKITKAMMVCLESKDYVQIRNALIILIRILPSFPVLVKLSQFIEKKVEKVKEDEKNQRQDLFTLALSYSGQLKSRMPQMVKESDFHLVSEKPSKGVDANLMLVKPEPPLAPLVGPAATPSVKPVNGEVKEKEKPVTSASSTDKVKESSGGGGTKERRTLNRISSADQSLSAPVKQSADMSVSKRDTASHISLKEKSKERDQSEKEKSGKKEERSKKEEKVSLREERVYREERYVESMPLSKDELSSAQSVAANRAREDRELSSVSNSSSGSVYRRSIEPAEADRDGKRRKLEVGTSSKQKHEERKAAAAEAAAAAMPEKKERREKSKGKIRISGPEKELRKERKLGRKRDRADEAAALAAVDQKRRKDEEKAAAKLALNHQNGDQNEPHLREKHHYTRDVREHDRSHDRLETREKHRRSNEAERKQRR